MILNHVANRAGLVVESPSSFDAEGFRHGDLNALDVVSIPKRFHERIRESKNHDVVHWPLTQIVVDSKDRGLRKNAVEAAVETLSGSQIMAERLFDHDSSIFRAPRLG